MNQRQKVCILGSTGSVGVSTLDVLARHPDRFEVFALTAHGRQQELLAQVLMHKPTYAALVDAQAAQALRAALREAGSATEVLEGERALVELAAHPQVDTVMAAVVGAAGLAPCLAAAAAGKRLLLANKEAIVVGGALFMQAVADGGATLIPIDSEHSAIFQCLPGERTLWPSTIDHIVLTASGGPFRTRPLDSFDVITPEQACAHPNWRMGRKISVDSATMMNKALEVIEAHWLFGLAPEQIRVLIHPQSIIHSMVVCRDQSVLAQLGTPDMRVPIAYGLGYPQRIDSGASTLDWLKLAALTFEAPAPERFPALLLAWDALRGPSGATAVLNAANEIAVQAFLEGRIGFPAIAAINAQVLSALGPDAHGGDLASLMALDALARARAGAEVSRRRL